MLAITETGPLSREDFRAALLASITGMRAEGTRFYQLLQARRCPAAMLREYGRATVRSADLFCATLAEMAEKAPDTEARLVLLENLMEEEGIFLQAARGLTVRPEAAHPALARRFAEAVGAGEEVDDARHATGPGRAMLARGEWVEAVAHLLVGQELHFSDAAPKIGIALQKNGLSARETAFFSVHATADCRHGEQALDLVLSRAQTRAQQDRCITEAHAGAAAWVAAHGGLKG